MIAGVAGGIAEYAHVDPTIVRLLFILLALAGGSGVVIYAAARLVTPDGPAPAHIPTPHAVKDEAPAPAEPGQTKPQPTEHGRLIAGLMLIALGGALLLQQSFGINLWHYVWPAAIIAAGLLIILRRS